MRVLRESESPGTDSDFPRCEDDPDQQGDALSDSDGEDETFDILVNFLRDSQGMTRDHQDKMLRHIKSRHDKHPDFPSNLYYMDKMLEPHYMKTTPHLYCLEHGNYLGIAEDISGVISCGSQECLLFITGSKSDSDVVGVFTTISIKQSLQLYLESVASQDVFSSRYLGHPERADFDLYDGVEYKRLELGERDISITFHIDDGQAFGIHGSRNGSVKMLSYIVNELPSRKRYRHRFLYGLAVGVSHPSTKIMMDLFASEISVLEKDGIVLRDEKGQSRTTRVQAPLFNSDTQARWDALGLSSFHAQYGCTSCLDPGIASHPRKYPSDTAFVLRTNSSVFEAAKEALRKGSPVDGVRYATRLLRISSFCPVRGATHDYMHCGALGVVKTGLLKNWMELKVNSFPFADLHQFSSRDHLLGAREQRVVDGRMLQFR